MRFNRRNHLGLVIAGDAYLQRDLLLDQAAHQLRILHRRNAVADPLRSEGQRRFHALRPSRLSGVDRRGKPIFSDLFKHRRKPFRRIQGFRAGNIHRADNVSQIFFCRFHCLEIPFFVVLPAHTAQDQPDADGRILLHAALYALDRRLNRLFLGHAALDRKLGRKPDLRIGNPLLRQILRQLKGCPFQRLPCLKHKKRQIKTRQIFLQRSAVLGNLHLIPYFVNRVCRKLDILFLRQLPDRLRTEGTVQM